MPDSVSWTEPPYKAGDRIDLPGPTVCAVMLTRGTRPEYYSRALECFKLQTYANRMIFEYHNVGDVSVGELRNRMNKDAPADIIVHWDDDDWSHPNRIAEQVALLQSSGAECVGYNEMLFWNETTVEVPCNPHRYEPKEYRGSAWLYRNGNRTYALGTSLCYWRSVWERLPFESLNAGEDAVFIQGLRSVGVSAVPECWCLPGARVELCPKHNGEVPRMIARIHACNTAKSYSDDHLKAQEWRRVPEWDEQCRKVME